MTALALHTAEWHEARRHRLGASDLPVLLGLSSFKSPWSLWAEKSGLLEPEPESQRQRIGRRAEALIAAEFHDATGLYVAGEQMVVNMPGRPEFSATLDGFVIESDNTLDRRIDNDPDLWLGIFEAKTDGRFAWPDGPPPAYLAQTRWAMLCAGLRHAWIAVMFAGWRFEVFEVEQDDADAAFMLAKAEEFWRLVEEGNPPPLDGTDATAAAIAHIWPDHTPGTIHEASDDLAAILSTRTAVKARMAADKKVVDELDNEIAATIGESELIAVAGVPAWSYKGQVRETVDGKALAAAHGLDAEPYTKRTPFRVLRPISTKEKK